MKSQLFALCALSLAVSANATPLISTVYDGPLSGGVPKGVEIYWPEAVADASVYGLGSANNGGGSDGEEFTFPAIAIAAGSYTTVASEAHGFTAFFGQVPDFISGAMAINGDDAIELFHQGVVIDTFGDINQDGTGTAWDYQDGWAARVQGSAGAFQLANWQFSGIDALDGVTSNTTAAKPIPLANGDDGDDGEAPAMVKISTIQGTPETQTTNSFGDSDVSPLIGEIVSVEAIVVGDFQDGDADGNRNLNGFFLQEETADEDGDARSSEGIFVAASTPDVQLGDTVRVTGKVGQYFGETQLYQVSSIEVVAPGTSAQLALVTPAHIQLPAAAVSRDQAGNWQPDLEAYEGMLVRFPQTLTLAEQFQLDRFNEVSLVAGNRPYQFTQLNAPDAAGNADYQRTLGAACITLDDGLNVQNAPITLVSDYRTETAPRMGDQVTGLTGVLDYKWAGNSASGARWRVRAHVDGANDFTRDWLGNSPNPRPILEMPEGNLRVASVNVLNFFTTLDNGSAHTALGHAPRGADDLSRFGVDPATFEYDRQLQKLAQALFAMDAHLLGLVELENAFATASDSAIDALATALNALAGEPRYAVLHPADHVGTDAIAVGILYQPATVSPEGTPVLLDDAVVATLPGFAAHDFATSPIFNGEATNRVPVAASFRHRVSDEVITLSVNHFKSKGASGLTDTTSPDYDQADGAGFWNARRTLAAQAVSEWLASAPTGVATDHQIIAGDLNAYAMESPVQTLLARGFRNVEPELAYSYVFDGQLGTLDYLLVSDSLHPALTQAVVWHINADEADALDYNADFGRDSGYYSASTAVRFSDHDPVLAGFHLVPGIQAWPDLLGLYDRAVAEGKLVGTSAHPWLQHFYVRLYRLQLQHLIWLGERGRSHQACARLPRLQLLSDGEARPGDWLAGAGRAAWAGHLRLAEQAFCPVQ
ncbi:ExeM/NucH family extracellular endonuclease [Simiduia agarivorans]|uniref:Extracellular nuclease-like protein n=1 Tax=Simiduia agarivorans (strain DSM 21679 / JCM 13881 / BCRC 17597 / SA1) TaxID=1117647 RepID=K4KMV4_SIMAS|nr:ExeM/NucH family extracellular endonuclease [Simiduia agarivorans]AFV00352.1 extracellular nuclease-like protein [Simiduia agarivorans SA1 = DSM 21679]